MSVNDGPNKTEKEIELLGIKCFCNPCFMPSVEWINGVPYYQAYKARSCIYEKLNELEKQNAYLRMLAAKAISRIYRMRYSMAWIDHPFEKGRKKERYEKWIDKFVDLYRKAKKEFENLKGM